MKFCKNAQKNRAAGTTIFFAALAFSAAIFSGCASENSISPLVGAWIADASENENLPKNSSVLINFHENGFYTIFTNFSGKESRADGAYKIERKNLIFDEKTTYVFELGNDKNSLSMKMKNEKNAPETLYKRVVLELEPTSQ